MPCTCANLNWQFKLQLVLSSRRSDSWMDTAGTAVGESKPIAGLTHCSISLSGLIAWPVGGQKRLDHRWALYSIPVMMECTLPTLWRSLFVQRECGSLVVRSVVALPNLARKPNERGPRGLTTTRKCSSSKLIIEASTSCSSNWYQHQPGCPAARNQLKGFSSAKRTRRWRLCCGVDQQRLPFVYTGCSMKPRVFQPTSGWFNLLIYRHCTCIVTVHVTLTPFQMSLSNLPPKFFGELLVRAGAWPIPLNFGRNLENPTDRFSSQRGARLRHVGPMTRRKHGPKSKTVEEGSPASGPCFGGDDHQSWLTWCHSELHMYSD